MQTQTKFGLEIGGEKTPAYIDYDQVDNVGWWGANIICDARKLPIEDNTYEHVYARNVLEHFSWTETKDVLKEWLRVVKPGGLLEIIVPDILGIIEHYKDGTDKWEHTVERIAGTQDYPGNAHLAFFTFEEFDHLLPEEAEAMVYVRSNNGGGIRAEIYK